MLSTCIYLTVKPIKSNFKPVIYIHLAMIQTTFYFWIFLSRLVFHVFKTHILLIFSITEVLEFYSLPLKRYLSNERLAKKSQLIREKDKNWTYNNYDNRKDHNHSSLYFPNNLPTRSCLRQGSFSDFALNIFMWEGNCWNLTAQEITQRFPTLLHVVHQQLLWWNKRLNAVIVLTVSRTQDTSWLGVCSPKKSVKNRI